MKTIALILARGGSKGLPNKNIKELNKKPLIYYTIEIAISSKQFDEIWINSDSTEILSICKKEFPNLKYYKRPQEYAQDDTSTYETIKDFLNTEFSNENIIFSHLQVTSPYRKTKHIIESLEIFKKTQCKHLISVKEMKEKKTLIQNVKNNFLVNPSKNTYYARQNEEESYYPNGSIWISTKDNYLKDKTFYTNETYAYKMSTIYSFDIDTNEDFIILEELMKNQKALTERK